MHRHGYKGRKFGRETDQRRALIKGLATSLVEHGSIETTLTKAKDVVPYVEVLITKAKRGDLHNRRQVIAGLSILSVANKLVDEIAPQLSGRVSGHLRIKRTRARVGDNAELARISFVDDVYSNKADTQKQKVAEEEVKVEKKAASKSVAPVPKKIVAEDKHLANKPAVSVRKSGAR